MNFVAQLEDYLRDLGSEARKKHPGVKEASERAILRLRTLQNAYVSAVRKAANSGAEHPTTSLFQSQDLLHPFLLAANYPNASTKLLDISFKAMRLLMESNAICPGDGIHMVRVWTIQAHVIMSQYQKHHRKSSSVDAGSTSSASAENTAAGAAKAATSSASSFASSTASWLGGWVGGGSSNSASSGATSTTADATMRNAVSSSSGHSGQQYSAPSNKDMEKVALEILSCLLQLTELLKQETLPVDLWTQSVSLCCLLLDFKKTVQQAAHSTLPQVLSILYRTSNSKKYNLQTWEDLLNLASYGPQKKTPTLHGAFSQCRLNTSSTKAPPPPSPELAIELMANILKEQPDLLATSDKFLSKTMGVTVTLLHQQTTSQSFNLNKTLRVFQWALVVLQTQAHALIECRELLMHVIKPIQATTEACRRHHDFEDGFIYAGDASSYAELDTGPAAPNNQSSRRLTGADGSSSQPGSKSYVSLLPTANLWKAGLALETIYHVLSNCARPELAAQGKRTLSPLLDKDTTVVLTEALSDFATIGSCCQGHILQLVELCNNMSSVNENNKTPGSNGNDAFMPVIASEEDYQAPDSIQPMLFHKAEQLIKTGSATALFEDNASKPSSDRKLSMSSSSYATQSVMGETLWVAYNGILQIVVGILPNLPPDQMEPIAEGSFAPIMATLQHYLKRVPGSKVVTRLSLNGYFHLANLCMPSTTEARAVRRKALFTSLCKLSLPAWGKHDAASQLANCHVRALVCLLRVVHFHYDHIMSEWDMVLNTFEELSLMPISSPYLSDQMYHAALAVSAAFGRFAPFSTCFTDDSLDKFVNALASVSSSAAAKRDLVTTNDPAVLDRVLLSDPSGAGDIPGGKALEEGKESIGGKLVNFGVRAIYGSQTSDLSDLDSQYDVPIAQRTKSSFYEAYRNDFVRRLEATTTSTLRPDLVSMLPFGLALLTDVAMANSFRYKKCAMPISRHICNFASVAPAIRVFIMDTVAMLILCRISKEKNLMSFTAPARVVFPNPKQNQLLAVEPTKPTDVNAGETGDEIISQAELFSPLCECIRNVQSAAVAESGITILTSILEREGHNLEGEVWVVIVNAIASLSGDTTNPVDRTSSEWSNCCMLGFRCLKLIVDDFLDHLPPPSVKAGAARISLLDCCSSFGRSRHDVNASLTAIGLLWTIADQDAGADAIDRTLSRLVELASDSRPEVRNCSVNTLFSCIVGRGNGFTATQWESCICDTVFGVYNLVVLKANDSGTGKVDLDGNSKGASKSRYQVNVHHSRDSAGKQWVATQVLVLRGLSRVLRTFYPQLLEYIDDQSIDDKDSDHNSKEDEETESSEETTSYEDDETDEHTGDGGASALEDGNDTPWLVTAWSKILDFSLEAAAQGGGRDTLDLRYSGVELLSLCGQLSCKAGIQAALTPARVGTNFQVVNGALREVRNGSKESPTKGTYQRSHSKVTEACRETLFLAAVERMDLYRGFIAKDGRAGGDDSDMESTQIQVVNKYVTCLSSLYSCCKDNELSPGGRLHDKALLARYFKGSLDEYNDCLECRFVRTIITVAQTSSSAPASSSGPRFLSQAQRSSLELLRSMIKNGSSEAFLMAVKLSGCWLFWRKDDDKKGAEKSDQNGVALIGVEIAVTIAEEIGNESLSDICKALALWIALSEYAATEPSSDDKRFARRKAYFKHFLPLLLEGLKSSGRLGTKASPPNGNCKERVTSESVDDPMLQLVNDLWGKVRKALSRMLCPVTSSSSLVKISRASELMDIIQIILDNVPPEFGEELCTVLAQGASQCLAIDKANKSKTCEDSGSELTESEFDKMRLKFRQDALQVFKACYAAVCATEATNPALLTITDQAFSDALVAIKETDDDDNDGNAASEVSVDSFLMVCEALKENPGVEGLIVSSLPLLCKLVQTNHSVVRNAAAAALGAADVRQVLSDAREKCKAAEKRAIEAEKQVSDLTAAVEDLQKKNEALQQQVALSTLHIS